MNQPRIATTTAAGVTCSSRHVELPEFDMDLVLERVAQDHPDWSGERLAAAKLDYFRYLALCRLKPEAALIPTLDADEVWHTHILHTMQYRADCNAYFGYFLDHAPFNRRNEKFPVDYTAKLFLETFGVEYNVANTAECTNCNCTDGIHKRDKRIQ